MEKEKSLETLNLIKAEWDWALKTHPGVIAKRSGKVRAGQDEYYNQLKERIKNFELPTVSS